MVGLKLEIIEAQPDEEPATEKQIAYICALLRDVGASQFPEGTLQDLGKWQASSIIDQLLSFKKQLDGDELLDTARLEGLNDEEPASTDGKHIVVGLLIILVSIILIVWLF